MEQTVDERLASLGLTLPAPMQVPPDLVLPFAWCKRIGNRVTLSGHLPLADDGTLWPVTGKVGGDVDVADAYTAARRATLAMLATLRRELGSLDRIGEWVRIFGMVNTAGGFHQTAPVINGCSDLLVEVFGPVKGSHTRSAVGFAELPFNCPVEIEGEVLLD